MNSLPGAMDIQTESLELRQARIPAGNKSNLDAILVEMGAESMTTVTPFVATTSIPQHGDRRFWGIPNLYAIDGSIFPTSGGYNPTLTIEALAWRAAKRIAHRHGFTQS
jgi:hypothetical protein